MKNRLILLLLCALTVTSVFALEGDAKAAKKEAVKSHLKQHFKPYGFIRNYFAFDSRESMSGTGDL